ncbi:toxin-antitoxin system YwqK family antitoxin [Streptomyces sp. NPDC096310]|uniref:toxin-antitoxin system YwqK family antitoxin n=1 Tax=Streptomyces sp. NPDC096310 TaxID=3366082 RepID=UPI0037FD37B1
MGSLMDSVHRIDIDDPDVDTDMGQRMLYQGELFTGEVVEYRDEQMVYLDVYTEGVRDGLSQGWHPDGSRKSLGTVRKGMPRGEFREWHANGVLKSRQFFDDDIYSLRDETTWDEQGNVIRDWHRE